MKSKTTFDGKLNLDCGFQVTLSSLSQSVPSSNTIILEGMPPPGRDGRRIDRLIDCARKAHKYFGKPHLIEPEYNVRVEALPNRRRPWIQKMGLRKTSHLEPKTVEIKTLPRIECIGVFNSGEPARGENYCFSSLIVVWFQNQFGIDQSILEKIRLIDWDKYATNWDI